MADENGKINGYHWTDEDLSSCLVHADNDLNYAAELILNQMRSPSARPPSRLVSDQAVETVDLTMDSSSECDSAAGLDENKDNSNDIAIPQSASKKRKARTQASAQKSAKKFDVKDFFSPKTAKKKSTAQQTLDLVRPTNTVTPCRDDKKKPAVDRKPCALLPLVPPDMPDACLLCNWLVSDAVTVSNKGYMDYPERLEIKHGRHKVYFKGDRMNGYLPKYLTPILNPLLRKGLIYIRGESVLPYENLGNGVSVVLSLFVYIVEPIKFLSTFGCDPNESQDNNALWEKAAMSKARKAEEEKERMDMEQAAFRLLQWAQYGDDIRNEETEEKKVEDDKEERKKKNGVNRMDDLKEKKRRGSGSEKDKDKENDGGDKPDDGTRGVEEGIGEDDDESEVAGEGEGEDDGEEDIDGEEVKEDGLEDDGEEKEVAEVDNENKEAAEEEEEEERNVDDLDLEDAEVKGRSGEETSNVDGDDGGGRGQLGMDMLASQVEPGDNLILVSRSVEDDDEKKEAEQDGSNLADRALAGKLQDRPIWALNLHQAADPPGFTPDVTLRPYQKQALHWMFERETSEISAEELEEQLQLQVEVLNSKLPRPYVRDRPREGVDIACECGPVQVSDCVEKATKTLTGHADVAIHPLWRKRYMATPDLSQSFVFYVQELTCRMSVEAPMPPKPCAGGVLADAMGLGKTVSVCKCLGVHVHVHYYGCLSFMHYN
jgi:SNF2-related domain